MVERKARRKQSFVSKLMTTVARFVEEKAEKCVYPEHSLAHITPRLQTCKGSRSFKTRSPESERRVRKRSKRWSPRSKGTHSNSRKSEKGLLAVARQHIPPPASSATSSRWEEPRIRMEKENEGACARRQNDKEEAVDAGSIRASFREELSRRKWRREQVGMREESGKRHNNLAPLLEQMRIEAHVGRLKHGGKREQFPDWNTHVRSFPTFFLIYIAVLTALFVGEAYDQGMRAWLERAWVFAIVDLDVAPDESGRYCYWDIRHEMWRFVTYQFIHSDVMHLVSNCACILVFGGAFEWSHGIINSLVVVQSGIIIGAITVAVASPYSRVIGASAGLYALGGAHVANVLINWNTMGITLYVRIAFIAAWIAFESLQQAGILNSDPTRIISHVCHFGGFGSGLLLGMWFTDNLVLEKWDKCIKIVGATIAFCLISAGVVYVAVNDISTC